ncbi:MAG TPA: response regulator [Gemmatimonadaceae bacterium]|nr:response regulator [Gemmatimonadaceae bacterium]
MSDAFSNTARTLSASSAPGGTAPAVLQPQSGARRGLVPSSTLPAPSPVVRFASSAATAVVPRDGTSSDDRNSSRDAHPRYRVLLVEDEANVRQVARRVLVFAGFQVVAAPNGHEALDILRREHGLFDVVLSDVMMPEMDGIEFASRAKAEFPSLRFVFMTGYSDLSNERDRAAGLCEAVVSKPFDMDQLALALLQAASKPR